ncbi:MAG: hypothetical protein ISS48_00550 [Candidatus Aenigmarchaeota archaeon]|nr:hypothetical protein [Candidatus Aenigmarchaeota archaeon]
MIKNIDKWFIDYYSDTTGLAVEIEKILYHKKSRHQDVKIIQTKDLGKVLLLDNFIYRSEWFGNIIPEMLTNVPMLTGNKKKKILLIGGGDGWTQNEILKYDFVERLDMVDIDEAVIEACKTHFDPINKGFDDPRLNIHIIDGKEFLEKSNEVYDLIIISATAPFNADGTHSMAYRLYQKDFFELCKKRVSEDGIFIIDGSNVFYGSKDIAYSEISYITIMKQIEGIFPITKIFNVISPLIPGGLFAMIIASKKFDPESDISIENLKFNTEFYNLDIHKSCFKLPNFMQKLLRG